MMKLSSQPRGRVKRQGMSSWEAQRRTDSHASDRDRAALIVTVERVTYSNRPVKTAMLEAQTETPQNCGTPILGRPHGSCLRRHAAGRGKAINVSVAARARTSISR